MIDLAGHFCYGLLFIGMLLLGGRHPLGWALRLAGELGWVAIGVTLGLTSIWVWGLLFCVVDFRNWRKWNDRRPT
jgi:hypothetical protein